MSGKGFGLSSPRVIASRSPVADFKGNGQVSKRAVVLQVPETSREPDIILKTGRLRSVGAGAIRPRISPRSLAGCIVQGKGERALRSLLRPELAPARDGLVSGVHELREINPVRDAHDLVCPVVVPERIVSGDGLSDAELYALRGGYVLSPRRRGRSRRICGDIQLRSVQEEYCRSAPVVGYPQKLRDARNLRSRGVRYGLRAAGSGDYCVCDAGNGRCGDVERIPRGGDYRRVFRVSLPGAEPCPVEGLIRALEIRGEGNVNADSVSEVCHVGGSCRSYGPDSGSSGN